MADESFVIMQIGNSQLDKIWKEVYLPATVECKLDPKRVDKHNEGRLLNSEIAEFIKRAKIIIADLTNERPNCYLEIGYAMGIDKFQNLILCAREDHNPDSPNYKKGGPKVHFDLSGYDILWWEEKNLSEFKVSLIKRIKHRLEIVKSSNFKRNELKVIDRIELQPGSTGELHTYKLMVEIENIGSRTINDIHVENFFPKGVPVSLEGARLDRVIQKVREESEYDVYEGHIDKLIPGKKIERLFFKFQIDHNVYRAGLTRKNLIWKIYADDMKPIDITTPLQGENRVNF